MTVHYIPQSLKGSQVGCMHKLEPILKSHAFKEEADALKIVYKWASFLSKHTVQSQFRQFTKKLDLLTKCAEHIEDGERCNTTQYHPGYFTRQHSCKYGDQTRK